MMEPILGQIALLPQLNETEELRPDLIHFAGEVHRRLLKDRFRDQRLGGDARVAGGERQIFDPLKVIGEDKRDEGQQRQQGH